MCIKKKHFLLNSFFIIPKINVCDTIKVSIPEKCHLRRLIMGTYTLKTIGKSTDYMTIIKEMEDGYVVKIVRDEDGYDDVTTDYISKTLFDSCIRTGYLTKVATEEKAVVNA